MNKSYDTPHLGFLRMGFSLIITVALGGIFLSIPLAKGQGEKSQREVDLSDCPVIELVRGQKKKSGEYVIYSGTATNISNAPLRNVQAVVEFYTEENELITYETTSVEYNPLMPGQKSPFKVRAKVGSEWHHTEIGFKTLEGEKLEWTLPGSWRIESERLCRMF